MTAHFGGGKPLVYRDQLLPLLRQFVGQEGAELTETIILGGFSEP